MKKEIELKKNIISLFNDFSKKVNGENLSQLQKIRTEAINNFKNSDFPTTSDEEWRYTNIAPIFNFDFIASEHQYDIPVEILHKYKIENLPAFQIVTLNGSYLKEYSDTSDINDTIFIGSLVDFFSKHPNLALEHLSKNIASNDIFSIMNIAFLYDGTVVYIPDDYGKVTSIHILNITGSPDIDVLSQCRNIIIAGKNSKLKIIETNITIHDRKNLINTFTDIVAGENSNIEYYRIQNDNSNTFHFSKILTEQKRYSEFTSYAITTGGAIVRNNIDCILSGEGCNCNLFGVYITSGKEHVDNHTLIDHAKPNCTSNEFYKGILYDKSRAVFNGKVLVRHDAQKTNAYQSNKNILLSYDAVVDTKPQLEIFADDVKCSHGATVGQLDEESVFYLRSRGLDEKTAKQILIEAFSYDIIEKIPNFQIKNYINSFIRKKLNILSGN